ncbi:MAG: 50S ribosomal protein L29 [Pseudomonadota bacterium]
MTKITEFKSKTPDELKGLVVSLKKELFNLRFQVVAGELTNNARFKQVRRDVARVKTLLSADKVDMPKKKTQIIKVQPKKKVAGE